MNYSLINLEKEFENVIQKIKISDKPGTLLPAIPIHEKWDEFLEKVKTEWTAWHDNLDQYPFCLIVLYCGLAFFEYDENTFWPQFCRAIGTEHLPANQQTEINIAFSKAVEKIGLKIQQHNKTNYVGSAVYYIGIPLSLWDGFLEICEWALWHEDWKILKPETWNEFIEKRIGSRKRLKKFLIDNREAANVFIKEMLDARKILKDNPNYTINDLSQACLLRQEYFNEVPETADFLRPENPESLFQDRARLVWNEQRMRISLYLPKVDKEKLPATWSIDTINQNASNSPDEIILNSKAFNNSLVLKLSSGQNCEEQKIKGLYPFGLFDIFKDGCLINLKRDNLPLREYVLVSKEPIQEISQDGFEKEENPINKPFELSDGSKCFITRLVPNLKYAELILKHKEIKTKIIFRTRTKIEAQFFAGIGNHAANFTRLKREDKIKIEKLPILYVAIPDGYFNNNESVLDNKFKIFIDDKRANGVWKKLQIHSDNEKEFYFWKWEYPPFLEFKETGVTLKNFSNLKDNLKAPNLHGDHTLSIKSPEFNINYKIELVDSIKEMKECWENLPGSFLPWFLLCQSNEGMKWEDLMFAKDIIAPDERISYPLLRKYEERGLYKKNGHKWLIAESRATIKNMADKCLFCYCGDPSILWGLYRKMYYCQTNLPIVEIIDKKREVPYLQMSWECNVNTEIEKYLRKKGVRIGDTLWNH